MLIIIAMKGSGERRTPVSLSGQPPAHDLCEYVLGASAFFVRSATTFPPPSHTS